MTRSCGFLDLGLHDDGADIVLRIEAPPAGRFVLDKMVATFLPPPEAA